MRSSPDCLAAALQGLGYSAAQAERLACDPRGEVARIAGQRFRAPARPKPATLPYAKRSADTAENGRRIFHGYRPELLVRAGGRWVASRKAAMVEAVRAGALTVDDLERSHGVTAEEWADWVARYDRGGAPELKATSRRAIRSPSHAPPCLDGGRA